MGTASVCKAGPNGKRLPKPVRGPVVSDDELKGMTTEELVQLVNGGHMRFVGALRKALVNDARVVGAALLQLKARHQHGKWGDWLKKHFNGSSETARLYMRIAKNWPLVVEHGLHEQGLTLQELRWILSESPGERPGTEARKKTGKSDTAAMAEPSQGEQTAVPEPPGGEESAVGGDDVRQYVVVLDPDQAEEMADMVAKLQQSWEEPTRHDAVYRAVKTCYQQEVTSNA
jgi:hypothetical protein